MGIALILLGLVAAGTVVDFLLENELGEADQAFSLFGGTFTMSQSEVVLGAAVLGALAVVFLGLGMGAARGSWGRRRTERHRMRGLEDENASLVRENAELRNEKRGSGPWVTPREEMPSARSTEVHEAGAHERREHPDEVHAHRTA